MKCVLNIKRLDAHVPLPTYAHDGDAGCDVYTTEEVTLAPGGRAQVGVGFAIELPKGYVALVWDKSGLSHKHGIKTLGGVVDAGYRGEIKVGVVNLGNEAYTFKKHQKIAQILIQKVETPHFIEVETLSPSERGEGGFGSTGK